MEKSLHNRDLIEHFGCLNWFFILLRAQNFRKKNTFRRTRYQIIIKSMHLLWKIYRKNKKKKKGKEIKTNKLLYLNFQHS